MGVSRKLSLQKYTDVYSITELFPIDVDNICPNFYFFIIFIKLICGKYIDLYI
jgi:hypothetical protein